MPVESASLFSKIIQDHLELKRKNAQLEHEMPIERYKSEDPFNNHPLFKTEQQARIEETMDGMDAEVVAHASFSWPGEESIAAAVEHGDGGLWTRSRDFDWGD